MKVGFFCNKHLNKYEFICSVCKVNLCILCKKEHVHINSIPFFEENKNEICFKTKYTSGTNTIAKSLYDLCKCFIDCYSKGKENHYLSINIISNYYLAKEINPYLSIDNNLTNDIVITSNYFENNKDENNFLAKSFGDYEFMEYYENLIFGIYKGDIESFKEMNKILDFYKRKKKKIQKIPFNKSAYLFSLSNSICIYRNEFLLIDEIVNSTDMKLLLIKLIKLVENMKLKINFVEANVEMMKKLNLEAHYKLDYELRRKTGNIISKSLLFCFFDKLDKIDPNKYIFYAVEALEEKIRNEKKINRPENIKIKYQKDLKQKYSKSLIVLI